MLQKAALPVAEAQRRILARVARLPVERIAIRDALGRVPAEPVISRFDLPPWDNSAMDGYAVRSADVRAGERLPVALDLPAGSAAGQILPAGAAARIMTGAPLPENADAIVPIETSAGPHGAAVYADPGEWVAFEAAPAPGHHVRLRGEDVRRGDQVVAEGQPFTPARMALAASVGAAEVAVFRRPTVTIVSTGDELVGVERAGEPGRIVNANAYGLAAMVEEAGGVVEATATVGDDEPAVRRAIQGALRSDAVVTVGGVSIGARDPVRPALAGAGVELDFWRVAVKPGGPTAFGVGPEGRPVFALPGNPVSALVTFELFVRPGLRRMAGHRACFRRPLWARLAQAVDPTPGKLTCMRCRLEADGDGWRAVRAGPQGSGVLSTLAGADGLALVPDAGRLEAGSPVEVWPLTDAAFHQENP